MNDKLYSFIYTYIYYFNRNTSNTFNNPKTNFQNKKR